ncbi:hypothetical protein NUW58_g9462 [Xylaria curta]|uniref:Uncharacterized protein n=1 Tax=Xylaria curta TaxID=42375 RepID=A0ACC1MWS3_9PEZI|nr:hypothetical protein NUW58_g9462 [Xylaria curta]
MTSQLRKILVVGATGQQGSALLSELSHLATTSSGTFPNLKTLALTRKASSQNAQSLVQKYGKTLNLELVEGNTQNPEPIFAAHKDIDTVFSYTTMPVEGEEAQAKPLITASAKHGVKHFVFSSVERGGDERSWSNPTDVPHFQTKHNSESDFLEICPKLSHAVSRQTRP